MKKTLALVVILSTSIFAANGPVIKPTVPAGGMTQLTGDVTAGPGSGSQAATLNSAAVLTSIANGTVAGNLGLSQASGDAVFNLHAGAEDSSIQKLSSSTKPLVIYNEGLAGLVIDAAQGWTSTGNLPIKNGSQGIRTNAEITAGTQINDATAVLQADSTTQGFLPPRMTTTQKLAITTPTEGLTVYDLTLHKLSVFTGTIWETVTSG